MEKTSILDFIAKLTGGAETAESPLPEERTADEKPAVQKDDGKPTYTRSYNPFADAEGERRQISSPRAAKPPKSKIDLNGGKIPSVKARENPSDMVKLINRHNAIADRIKKNKDENR